MMRIEVEKNKTFEHTITDNDSNLHSLEVIVHEGAKYFQKLLLKDAEQITIDQKIYLAGAHAQAEVTGTAQLSKTQKHTITIAQVHQAPDTQSFVQIKSVLDGAAQFEYYGTMTIEKTAPRSDAQQTNKNLLLSDKASARAIPALEALHSDVQCGHATATSYLDSQQMFYLMSRGIPEQTAQQILVSGFLRI